MTKFGEVSALYDGLPSGDVSAEIAGLLVGTKLTAAPGWHTLTLTFKTHHDGSLEKVDSLRVVSLGATKYTGTIAEPTEPYPRD